MVKRFANITPYILSGGTHRRSSRGLKRDEAPDSSKLELRIKAVTTLFGSPPILVGNREGLSLDCNIKIVPDAQPSLGPMAGLIGALEDSSTDWCLVSSVDMPFLNSKIINWLSGKVMDEYDVVSLSLNGDPEPFASIYHKRTAPFWRKRLMRGKVSLVNGILKLNSLIVRASSLTKALQTAKTFEQLEEALKTVDNLNVE